MAAANRRVEAISRHLTLASESSYDNRLATARQQPGPASIAQFNARDLYLFITRDNVELRDRMMEHLKDPLYQPNYYLSLMEFRDLTLRRLQLYTQQRFFSVRDYLQDPRRFMAGLEALALADYSLSIKAGVHFTLCGGTIAKLGTAKHHAAYFDRLDDLRLPGCFGMTELGHGSNVMGIETQATYDPQGREFVINTPSNTASKFWIGGAAQHGKLCTVFAQLTVGGKWQGPHVFAVRIRDDTGNAIAGVRIHDNGPKMGLNGVDNGQIWFDNYRVPRDALLDAFASVDEAGNYSSPIPSVAQRFGTMVGGLTTGRMLIAQAAVDACKMGVTIALAYAAARPQFGDKPVLAYLTHQRRLLPALATTFALQFAMLHLKDMVAGSGAKPDPKQVHVISSGLKAGATWSRVEILQAARECCGGQGFLAANKIGALKTDMDIDTTFEGDNTVLMQQVAKALLDGAMRSPNVPLAPSIPASAVAEPPQIATLLQYREEALVGELAGAMAAAGRAAARAGKAAAAEAATAAFEARLDDVVALGWASHERSAFQVFAAEAARAPPQLRPALQALLVLYGLTRVERTAAFHLARGALTGAHTAAIHTQVNVLCAELAADGGAVAQALCQGFGIPEHLLQAPIYSDWRRIGA